MTLRCNDDYFKKTGVLVDIPTAGGGTITKVNFCHEKWVDYWMCQLPDGVESFAWCVIGYLMHLAQCEGLCDCGEQECGKSLCGVECGDLDGKCPDGYQCSEEGQCAEVPCEEQCGDQECGTAGPQGECDCGQCPPGQLCSLGQCVEPICVPNCAGKECGDDGCGGSCGECAGPGGECVQGTCICPSEQKMAQYEELIDALEPFLQGFNFDLYQRILLTEAISELECGNTAYWAELQSYNKENLTEFEVDLVWLRWVAVSLFNEVNQNQGLQLGWKLLDLDGSQLQCVLGRLVVPIESWQLIDAVGYTGADFYPDKLNLPPGMGDPYWTYAPYMVWACDPASANAIAAQIRQWILDQPELYDAQSPHDALCGTIDYMRVVLDWGEFASKPITLPPEHGSTGLFNLEDVFQAGAGGCYHAAYFIRWVMRCMNVPIAVGGAPMTLEEGSSHFSFLAKLSDGDYTITSCADLVFRFPFKYRQAAFDIVDLGTYMALTEEKNSGPVGAFNVEYELQRKAYLDWLGYLYKQDPAFGVWHQGLWEQLFIEYGRDCMLGPNSVYGESAMPSNPYLGLNVPLGDAVGNPDGLLLKDDSEVKGKLNLLWDLYCSTKAYDEALAHKEWALAQLEIETDPAKIAKYETDVEVAELQASKFGCASGGNCMPHYPYIEVC